ncbi:RHS repeat-associated core domain-containing protein, partial [Sulfurirhabdus autotrophica]
ETGLTYYRARFYDPSIARFVSRDPIGLQGGINQYTYVGNNPINLIDPLGLLASEPALPGDNMIACAPICTGLGMIPGRAATAGLAGGTPGYRGLQQQKPNGSDGYQGLLGDQQSSIPPFTAQQIGNAIGGFVNGAIDGATNLGNLIFNQGGSGNVDGALPNAEHAVIDPQKLTGYALNPDHPVGGNKAVVFGSALGYNQSNAGDLISQVQKGVTQNPVTLGNADQFGHRYTVDMPITGPNGNTANVRTGWIIDSGSTVPRLTTIYVK